MSRKVQLGVPQNQYKTKVSINSRWQSGLTGITCRHLQCLSKQHVQRHGNILYHLD